MYEFKVFKLHLDLIEFLNREEIKKENIISIVNSEGSIKLVYYK